MTAKKRKPGRPVGSKTIAKRHRIKPAPEGALDRAGWLQDQLVDMLREIWNNEELADDERYKIAATFAARITQSMPLKTIHDARTALTEEETSIKLNQLGGDTDNVEKTRKRSIRPKAT